MARAIIVIEDAGEAGLKTALMFDPKLVDGQEMTNAQAVGGHIFQMVNTEIKNLCETQVDVPLFDPVDAIKDADHAKALAAKASAEIMGDGKGVRIGAPEARTQFKTPTIIPGEDGDLDKIRRMREQQQRR